MPYQDRQQEFSAFAEQLADVARELVLGHLAQQHDYETKDDQSPVTMVDRAVEHALRKLISGRYPEHGILGEEFAASGLDAEYVWVIDPIDGTKAFIAGIPVYGTLIALTCRGIPILGIMEHPYTKERWAGFLGRRTTLNKAAVQTRPARDLARSIMAVGNPEAMLNEEIQAMDRLRAQTKWRIYGGSCYAYGRLACGQIQTVLDSGLDPFDFCALVPIVKGAGGEITDWEGRELTLQSGHRIVACADQQTHELALAALQSA